MTPEEALERYCVLHDQVFERVKGKAKHWNTQHIQQATDSVISLLLVEAIKELTVAVQSANKNIVVKVADSDPILDAMTDVYR